MFEQSFIASFMIFYCIWGILDVPLLRPLVIIGKLGSPRATLKFVSDDRSVPIRMRAWPDG